MIMLLSVLKYTIPLRACEMIMLLSALKYNTFMGLWNDYVVIGIKIYNLKASKKSDRFYDINIYIFKGSNKYENGPSKIYNIKGRKKYDRFYVIDFNFAKVY